MSFEIHKLTKARLKEAIDVLAEAFSDNPTYNYIFDGRKKGEMALYRNILVSTIKRGDVFFAESNGIIAGVAALHPPFGVDRRKKFSRLLIPTWRVYYWIRNRINFKPMEIYRMECMANVDRKFMIPEASILEILAVSTEHQKAGIGSSLLKHVVDYLKKYNAPIRLIASKSDNIPFYERNDFELLETIHDDYCPSSYCFEFKADS